MSNQNIYFTSPAHQERFTTAIVDRKKVYDGQVDPEYGAALYVLTSNQELWEKLQPHSTAHGLRLEEMLEEEYLSSGYVTLVKWAGNLFNSHPAEIGPVELMGLDNRNFQVALQALLIRRNPPLFSEIAK